MSKPTLPETAKGIEPSGDALPSSNGLTVQSRQFQLSKATNQYLNGEITKARLQEFEEALEVGYASAVLDHISVLSEVLKALKRVSKKWLSYVKCKF